MDDQDVLYELSEMSVITIILIRLYTALRRYYFISPINISIYNKLGNILCSFANTESAVNAIKYYSQNLLIKETTKA
jgi:hypothetical protein